MLVSYEVKNNLEGRRRRIITSNILPHQSRWMNFHNNIEEEPSHQVMIPDV